jgi:hypothetical protein
VKHPPVAAVQTAFFLCFALSVGFALPQSVDLAAFSTISMVVFGIYHALLEASGHDSRQVSEAPQSSLEDFRE